MKSTIKYWTPDFETLLLKVTSHPSDVRDIPELKSFYQKYEGMDDFDAIKFACEGLIAIILDHNGFYEESFEIYLRLLPQKSPGEFAYAAMIGGAAKAAEQTHRIEEVMPYIRSFLNVSNDTEVKNGLLRWYIRIFPEEQDGFLLRYEQDIIAMAGDTGIEVDRSIPFTDWVRMFSAELIRAEDNYSNLFNLLGEALIPDRSKIFEDYIAREPFHYYKDRAKRIFEFQQKRLKHNQ